MEIGSRTPGADESKLVGERNIGAHWHLGIDRTPPALEVDLSLGQSHIGRAAFADLVAAQPSGLALELFNEAARWYSSWW
jgi:hypothetical protein